MQGNIFGGAQEITKKKRVRKTTKKSAPKKREILRDELPGEPVEKVFSVGEFLDFVNQVFRKEALFIRGEISSFQALPSGCYFSMKDKEDDALLNCYMNPRVYRALGFDLEEGMEIKAQGTPNIYKPKGRFSFVVEGVELVGEGTLKKAYDALKKKLEAEGLFARKRELPEFISRVGIITSRTGAVIGDFRKNLLPLGLEIFLYDVRVEGARAADEIVRAVRAFNKGTLAVDILVVMRGGGSLEDLQAFNNEEVARAVFASRVPTICAIGHDRDVPIVSLVGDAAPSTPTAAAVLVNHSWERLRETMPLLARRLVHAFEYGLRQARSAIALSLETLLGNVRGIILHYRGLARDLVLRFARAYSEQKEKMLQYEKYLAAVSPERNLRLGYSIVLNSAGKVVKHARDLAQGDEIKAQLYEGAVEARVIKTND